MTRKKDTLSINEKLTQFTDQLLDDDLNSTSDGNAELKSLTGTVQKLHAAFAEEKDEIKAEEIRKKVMANWLYTPKMTNQTQPKRKKWYTRTSQRRFSISASLAVILILIVMAPTLLTTIPGITGSAETLSTSTLAAIILGVSLAAIIIWLLRRNK